MAREKIYIPVDPADVFVVSAPPRAVPVFMVQRAHRQERLALTLVSAAAGGALGGAWFGGWTALAALPLCVGLAMFGFWQRRQARWLLRVLRDGQATPAKVSIDLSNGPTELMYARDERDISASDNLAVFAGEPKRASVTMDYEHAGRIYSVRASVVGEGKPAAVRLGEKVVCGVLVHSDDPGRPLLITQKIAKAR